MKPLFAVCIAASFVSAGVAAAEPTNRAPTKPLLSVQASNPHTLGWMQGFPPAPGKTIRATDADHFAFPKLRWTVCHFRELMPTVGARSGATGASALPMAHDRDGAVTPAVRKP